MKRGFAKFVIFIIVLAIVTLVVAVLTIKSYVVTGDSMKPTFNNGQKVLINKLAYLNSSPLRGDIVVVGVEGNSSRIKPTIRRVVGLPSETIEIKQGRVYINAKVLDEPYLDKTRESNFNERPINLDASHYFVLADNRNTDNYIGTDLAMWSFFPKNFIIGKYWFSY